MAKRMSFGIEEMKAKKADVESDIKRLEASVTGLKREEITLRKHIKRQRAAPKRRKITGESQDAAGSQQGPPSSLSTQNLTCSSSDATKAPLRLPSPPSEVKGTQPLPKARNPTSDSYEAIGDRSPLLTTQFSAAKAPDPR